MSRGAGGRWAGGRARGRCLGPGRQVGPPRGLDGARQAVGGRFLAAGPAGKGDGLGGAAHVWRAAARGPPACGPADKRRVIEGGAWAAGPGQPAVRTRRRVSVGLRFASRACGMERGSRRRKCFFLILLDGGGLGLVKLLWTRNGRENVWWDAGRSSHKPTRSCFVTV